jgi:hypothetical protein
VDNHYVPGVCNIGHNEIRRRKIVGWSGLLLTIISIFLLWWLDSGRVWRLVVFIPTVIGAMGFIQAYGKFCVYFGFGHMFNFAIVGKTNTVEQVEFISKDVIRARQLLAYALGIGFVVTLIIYFMPL